MGVCVRSNPKYDNTCWIQFGRYQYRKCDACKRKEECDDWWDEEEQVWLYPITRISRGPIEVKLIPIPGGIYDTEIAPYL